MRRLSLATLSTVSPRLRPRVEPGSLRVGIVHLGIGAFHRAHQAVFTEDAIAAAGGSWGICGVTQRSPRVLEQLAPQDGLYAVAQRDAGGQRLRVIGAVRELRFAGADPGAVLRRIADPATRVVTLTVTEKGYMRDGATGGLDLAAAELAADLADPGGARTAIGQLAHGLERRRRAGAGPLTVVACDNLPANGRILARLVGEFAERMPDGGPLREWLAASVRFPSTMVDRIVPAPTPADRDAVARTLGVRDEGAVVAEPFRQWVIEDDFAAARPAWEAAGAVLTGDVRPYEQVKLRLLNASHSALAYLGALAGDALIADAVEPDGPFAPVIEALMADEAAPTLDPPAGLDLAAYRAQVPARFANPALPYRTLQVAADGSQKLPPRLLAPALERRRAGAEPGMTALAVAAWMRFVSAGRSDAGRPLPLEDPLAGELRVALSGASTPAQVVDALLALPAIFEPELAGDPVWRELLTERLEQLTRDGAAQTARRLAA